MEDVFGIPVRSQRGGHYCINDLTDFSDSHLLNFEPYFSYVRMRDSLNPMKILFEPSGEPHSSIFISYCVAKRQKHYAQTVQAITKSTEAFLDFDVFSKNAARLMMVSNMNRRGPFQGLRLVRGAVHDPQAILSRVWNAIGKSIVELKSLLLDIDCQKRSRVLVETPDSVMNRIVFDLLKIFKQLLPLCFGVKTPGLIAASKILFSAFPEIALPVEKSQWKNLFQTVDYPNIIWLMKAEIVEWEKRSQKRLDYCDPVGSITLPVFYDAALRARLNEK